VLAVYPPSVHYTGRIDSECSRKQERDRERDQARDGKNAKQNKNHLSCRVFRVIVMGKEGEQNKKKGKRKS
jgi:hypothetical protein